MTQPQAPTLAPRVPATPEESAVGFSLMRALLVHVLLEKGRRSTKPPELVYSRRSQDLYEEAEVRVMLRLVIDQTGAIRAWLESPEPDMRRGVPYVPALSPDPSR